MSLRYQPLPDDLAYNKALRMDLFKLLVLGFLFFICIALFVGLFFLVRDQSSSKRTIYSLTLRIALSVGLFVLLFIGLATRLIKPHGLPQIDSSNQQKEAEKTTRSEAAPHPPDPRLSRGGTNQAQKSAFPF